MGSSAVESVIRRLILLLLIHTARCIRVRSLWLDLRPPIHSPTPVRASNDEIDPYGQMLDLYESVSSDPKAPKISGPAIQNILVRHDQSFSVADESVSSMIIVHDDRSNDAYSYQSKSPAGRVLLDPSVPDINSGVRYAFPFLILQSTSVAERINKSLLSYAVSQAKRCSKISGTSRESRVVVCVRNIDEFYKLTDPARTNAITSHSDDPSSSGDSESDIVVALPPNSALWVTALSYWASESNCRASRSS